MLYLLFILFTFYSGITGFNPLFAELVANYLALYETVQIDHSVIVTQGNWEIVCVINKNSINDELEVDFNSIKKFIDTYDVSDFQKMYNDKNLLNEAVHQFKYNINGHLMINVKEIFNKMQINQLIISDKYYKMLNDQLFCLVNFLVRKYGTDNVIGYEVNEVINEETAIDNYFKIKHKGNYYVYRFNQAIDFSVDAERYYYHNSKEFQELNQCNKIIVEVTKKSPYEITIIQNRRRRFIDLNKLYKRFNPNQLYFDYIPIFEGEQFFKIGSIIVNDSKCAICLTEFEFNSHIKKTPCNHTFDYICLRNWTNSKNTCPVCRKELPFLRGENS